MLPMLRMPNQLHLVAEIQHFQYFAFWGSIFGFEPYKMSFSGKAIPRFTKNFGDFAAMESTSSAVTPRVFVRILRVAA